MFRGVDGAWRRDDSYGFDERARHNFTDQSGPRVNNLSSWENASIFAVAEHFLPVTYLQLMAAGMQDNARSKFYAGDRSYANFTVSYYDLLQWIGVWMYMLAFPQTGPRRAYFQEPFGGFGPRHRLAEWLRLGANGDKGIGWFERMHACFMLPSYSQQEYCDAGNRGDAQSDPFRLARRCVSSSTSNTLTHMKCICNQFLLCPCAAGGGMHFVMPSTEPSHAPGCLS